MKLIKASFIAFLITMIISSFILFFTLDIGETPEESDVIIVAGGQLYREAKAKELLEQDYSTSNKVIVSPITQNQKNARPPINDDIVNPDNIIAEPKATSTWTNATESIKIMDHHGWKSAIVVTSDFHTRRTKMSFERAKGNKDLNFIYVSAYPKQSNHKNSYLSNKNNRKWALHEIYKYWGYWFGLYYYIDI
ncbi:YdcF family protein [Globicatella sulfidifaciens]